MVWSVMLSPAFMVFLLVSSVGTIMAVMSSGLLGVWMSLELAFFGFIPILNGKSVCENESTVKYFIIQSIGSGFLLVSFLMISSHMPFLSMNLFSFSVVGVVMMIGFFIKLGIFPMHFWFPSVMGTVSWFSCFWLSVVQKIGPLWGISGLGMSSLMVNLFVSMSVLTSVVGSFGGLAQTQIRPLLAYSSLGQTGWMGLILISDLSVFIGYYILYSLIMGSLLVGLGLMNHYSIYDGVGWSEVSGFLFWMFSGSYFLSLAGMPPFSGFFLKLVGVVVAVMNFPFLLGVLMFTAMVSLYFYLSMFLSSVFCISSLDYGALTGFFMSSKVSMLVLFLGVLNWLGGVPLFLICGMTMV
uniref:NADH-ubiquinone oxidoreductase chain 2 n=1 Tax=Donax variegatus TaxID=1920007 RepID=A0A286NT50_9BIVA|nr:NADH dehydrogenase subunit 2 [Donax variegatus]ATA66409.1 NADH dehydrogenase subunit 2 [Donax variegatus]